MKQSINISKKVVVLMMVVMVVNISLARTSWATESETLASAAKISTNDPGGETSDPVAIPKKKGKAWIWVLLILALVGGGLAAAAGSSPSDDDEDGEIGEGSVEATW